MSEKLIPVNSLESFRFASLVPNDKKLTPPQAAALELLHCYDDLMLATPLGYRDLTLRFLRTTGLPIDYPGLPFWAEKAARHLFTICYPTLRKADFSDLSPEDFGRIAGHLLAMVSHAKAGTAIFQRLPKETVEECRRFLLKIESPLRVLVDDGLNLPPKEAEAFLRGLNHAFGRTFDLIGMPRGWNTNSPVLIGLCLSWRFIVASSPPLSELHQAFGRIFGKQEIGSEDRVKKVCSRLGLRFSGNRAKDSQGTTVVLDVPTEDKAISDK